MKQENKKNNLKKIPEKSAGNPKKGREMQTRKKRAGKDVEDRKENLGQDAPLPLHYICKMLLHVYHHVYLRK